MSAAKYALVRAPTQVPRKRKSVEKRSGSSEISPEYRTCRDGPIGTQTTVPQWTGFVWHVHPDGVPHGSPAPQEDHRQMVRTAAVPENQGCKSLKTKRTEERSSARPSPEQSRLAIIQGRVPALPDDDPIQRCDCFLAGCGSRVANDFRAAVAARGFRRGHRDSLFRPRRHGAVCLRAKDRRPEPGVL